MRGVDFDEFTKLPQGTLFKTRLWQDGMCFSPLFIKGESDHQVYLYGEQALDFVGDEDCQDRENSIGEMRDGKDRPLSETFYSKDVKDETIFYVLSLEDAKIVLSEMQQAVKSGYGIEC